jgi:hypothetical protein
MNKSDITSTLGRRRDATSRIVDELREIAEAEENYKDNIPENLQSGPAYEAAESALYALEEAISLLEEAYE